ncbi:hypothetical protein D3C87_1690570 [compost metagenome]
MPVNGDLQYNLMTESPTVNAHTVTEELKNWLWLGISSWVRELALFVLTHLLVFSMEPDIEGSSDKPQPNAMRLSKPINKWHGGNALGKGLSKHTS